MGVTGPSLLIESTDSMIKIVILVNSCSIYLPRTFIVYRSLITADKLILYQFVDCVFIYEIFSCFCAVPVGCTISQTDTSNLKYLYEGHPEFSVVPSYAVIPAQVRFL